jgi:hypothetical protein
MRERLERRRPQRNSRGTGRPRSFKTSHLDAVRQLRHPAAAHAARLSLVAPLTEPTGRKNSTTMRGRCRPARRNNNTVPKEQHSPNRTTQPEQHSPSRTMQPEQARRSYFSRAVASLSAAAVVSKPDAAQKEATRCKRCIRNPPFRPRCPLRRISPSPARRRFR